jgi:hypothetical protein
MTKCHLVEGNVPAGDAAPVILGHPRGGDGRHAAVEGGVDPAAEIRGTNGDTAGTAGKRRTISGT